MNRKSKVQIKWSPDFAYAVGLLATDGNLSPDGRHINLTTKDLQCARNFKKCLGIKNKIGKKSSGENKEKKYFVVQFGDVNFYEFLNSIGLYPAKSKTIRRVDVPSQYFADFLRGCLDGDGNISVFRHQESRHGQLKVRFVSASNMFMTWTHEQIKILVGLDGGWISKTKQSGVYTLSFGKTDSVRILKFLYYDDSCTRLIRKYKIAKKWLI